MKGDDGMSRPSGIIRVSHALEHSNETGKDGRTDTFTAAWGTTEQFPRLRVEISASLWDPNSHPDIEPNAEAIVDEINAAAKRLIAKLDAKRTA